RDARRRIGRSHSPRGPRHPDRLARMVSFWTVARRPRWIAVLVLALGVAAAFAALGQWQLARAVEAGTVAEVETERVVPLQSVATPNGPITSASLGQLVTTAVTWVEGEYTVLVDRLQHGDSVVWVVGHAVTPEGVSLA